MKFAQKLQLADSRPAERKELNQKYISTYSNVGQIILKTVFKLHQNYKHKLISNGSCNLVVAFNS